MQKNRARTQTLEAPEFARFGMDKVLMSCFLQPLQALSRCSRWAAESSPLGKCHRTSSFHSPPESPQLSVRYWHCPGLFLQAPALRSVKISAGNVRLVQ